MVKGSLLGDPDIELTGVAGLHDAREGEITFLASARHLRDLRASKASAVIVREAVEGLGIAQVLVSNPYRAFAAAIRCFHPQEAVTPQEGPSSVAATARLGRNVTVFPFVYISDGASIGDGSVVYPGSFIGRNAVIGRGCVIHPNVTIREDCAIGDRVTIHAGTVIGSDGFGYVFDEGSHHKIPQVGRVVIGDDVEIGANVSVDRATLGETVIAKGTKIDNLVQIAHNVRIGEHSIVVAQVGISGSSELGSHVTLAGQVGIADHTTIESGTIMGARSGTMGGFIKKDVYLGAPPMPHREFMKTQALFMKLPELSKKIKELEARLHHLEKEEHKE